MPVVDRRSFLMGAGALGAAAMLPKGAFAAADPLPEFTGFPEKLKGTGELRIGSAGGALAEAEHKAFIDYFAEHSGIKVNRAGFTGGRLR